jgi:hypothetical protein
MKALDHKITNEADKLLSDIKRLQVYAYGKQTKSLKLYFRICHSISNQPIEEPQAGFYQSLDRKTINNCRKLARLLTRQG